MVTGQIHVHPQTQSSEEREPAHTYLRGILVGLFSPPCFCSSVPKHEFLVAVCVCVCVCASVRACVLISSCTGVRLNRISFHGAWLHFRGQESGCAFSAAVCKIQARKGCIDSLSLVPKDKRSCFSQGEGPLYSYFLVLCSPSGSRTLRICWLSLPHRLSCSSSPLQQDELSPLSAELQVEAGRTLLLT